MDRRKVPGPGSDGKAQRLSRTHLAPPAPSPPAGQPSWPFLVRHARCIDADLDPDQWFPVSSEAGKARHEAAAALAICNSCPVRAECLALSLQHWDIGQHGIWGGLLAAERAKLRRRLTADDNGFASALMHPIVTASAR
jgi:WhiB family transcriptional regulator, redox-sensing transcriptional regulator